MLSRVYTGGGDVLKAPPGPEDPEPNRGHLQAQVSVGVSRSKPAKRSLPHCFLSHNFMDLLKDLADVLAGMEKSGTRLLIRASAVQCARPGLVCSELVLCAGVSFRGGQRRQTWANPHLPNNQSEERRRSDWLYSCRYNNVNCERIQRPTQT